MTELIIDADSQHVGRRLDRVLAEAFSHLSRTEIQQEIRDGHVSVRGRHATRPAHRLRAGDVIAWDVPDRPLLTPASMPLSIVYEDDQLIAIDKPSGLVVHPGAGTAEPTLVEGLLADRTLPVSDDPARPGIVHRLDKETSGILVIAKTLRAMDSLQRQFASRTTRKHYLAVVDGTFDETDGLVDAPIGRDPAAPQRMSIRAGGKRASTEFTVLATLDDVSLLWVRPRTGRTHQIRVHMRYTGHPVQGDDKYGGSTSERLMLHAWVLCIEHPTRGEPMEFRTTVPACFPEYDYEMLDLSRNAPRR